MKFNCHSSDILRAVSLVEKAIPVRSPLPIMENIYFELKEDTLILRANDLELGIHHEIKLDSPKENGSVLVKASTFSSILSKMNQQDLQFSVSNDNLMTIKSDSVDFEILGSSVSEYPAFPEVEYGSQFKIQSDELQNFIKRTIFSVSFDTTKQFLNGVLVKYEEGKLFFVSTDGFRLAFAEKEFSQINSDFSVIIPYRTLNEFNKILQQLESNVSIDVNVSENQVSFIMPHFKLVSRVIKGQFPDYNQVLPKSSEQQFSVPRQLLFSAAERALIIASQSNNVVRLQFGDETLNLGAVASKLGEFKEDIAIQRKGGAGEAKIAFNVKLLIEAVKNIDADDILVSFNNELSPCVVQPVGEDGYVYVIMPIRTSEYEEKLGDHVQEKESVEVV